MALTSELKEKIVMALLSTDREQCRGALGIGEARCANGVICEDVLEIELKPRQFSYLPGLYMDIDRPDQRRWYAALGTDLVTELSSRNDSGGTFDDCARLVKDWPCSDE